MTGERFYYYKTYTPILEALRLGTARCAWVYFATNLTLHRVDFPAAFPFDFNKKGPNGGMVD